MSARHFVVARRVFERIKKILIFWAEQHLMTWRAISGSPYPQKELPVAAAAAPVAAAPAVAAPAVYPVATPLLTTA
jgi:hypothetical protein